MIKPTKLVILGVGVTLLLVVIIVVVLQQGQKTAQQNTRKQQVAIADSVQGIANSYKPSKTYASLADTQKDEFLEQKAAYFGLPPGQAVTPEVLTNACLERRERELSGMIASNAEAIEANRDVYNKAAQKTREYCYQQYAKDGTIPHEDMPHSMAH